MLESLEEEVKGEVRLGAGAAGLLWLGSPPGQSLASARVCPVCKPPAGGL